MPPPPFGKERDVKLIRLVKMHPLIYDATHESYLDADKRDTAWQSIGEELQRPARSCKTRWINIRDNLRRKMREREKIRLNPTMPVNTMYNTYKYKYEDDLQFLYPFFKSCTTADEEYGEVAVALEDGSWVDPPELVVYNDSDYEDKVKPDVSQLLCESQEASSSNSMLSTKQSKVSSGNTEEKHQKDPVEVFLDVVGSTLRELNPYYLNMAKTRIFQVVQDCELQQIVNRGEIPTTPSNSLN